jgi:hypothetical protein
MTSSSQARPHLPLHAERILPGGFVGEKHFYAGILNAKIHPLVASFLQRSSKDLAGHYARLCPAADERAVNEIFSYAPSHFHWAGADLLLASDASGTRRMILLETNSCPSGQKSMPPREEDGPLCGYGTLLSKTFLRLIADTPPADGVLAVLHDKNPMENLGYAAALAELTGEAVYSAKWMEGAADPCVRVSSDRRLEVRDADLAWRPVRAALRYVTGAPWRRLPVTTRTLLLNPIAACLAGGRNKSLADRAYSEFNARHAAQGLKIRVPRTERAVPLRGVQDAVRDFGGRAVIKDPYSNAGQGVWTVTGPEELRRFLSLPHERGRFLLQELVGHAAWNPGPKRDAALCHVGTKPNAAGQIHAFDLRFMIASQSEGFRPAALYARRARKPLTAEVPPPGSSWGALGTNLSVKTPAGWHTETERLIPMDEAGFETLGLGFDDLVLAFAQTVFATVAIDHMAKRFMPDGVFNAAAFTALSEDASFSGEILI